MRTLVRSSPLTGRGITRARVAGAKAAVAEAKASARLTMTHDPLRILLFLLMIVTISRVHLHYPILAVFRPALLLSFGAVVYAFLNPRSLTSNNVLNLWPMRMVTLIFVLACCSAPFGISLGNSGIFILDSFFKTIVYAFLLAVSVRNARDLYTYAWAFVVSCGILSYFAVFVFGLETGGSLTARLGELYTYDSNDLGVLLMIGLPLTLMLLFVDRGFKRVLLLINLVGISAAMARSGSRGGFLGIVTVGLATLFLVNGISFTRRWIVMVVAAVVLAVAAPPGYWQQMGTILNPEKDYNVTSFDGRSALIKRGLGYMAKYPVFGIGIWNFAKAECTISPKVMWRPRNEALRCIAPHNSYVQAGTELGVPGLVSWVALLLGLIIAPLRLRRRLPRSWLKGNASERFLYAATSFFPVAMCGFAVTSFFVTFAFADPIYVMAALLSGLYTVTRVQLASARSSVPGLPVVPRRSRRGEGWRVIASARRLLGSTPDFSGAR
jgi:O-antigen ligase